MGQDHDGDRGLPISSARLCELEAQVCACGSGANVGIVQFTALMERKWCKPTQAAQDAQVAEVSEDR